ncbi:MAG: hypothetical protein JWM66_734 [Solirubrobacterales bacterium]|jgi:hypothetical protein|nr:hypothetical protein [Solirubrobacterales bacterium]
MPHRLPIRYTRAGAEDLRTIYRRFGVTDPEFLTHLLDELTAGFPADDASVVIDFRGEVKWTIRHPAFDKEELELDFDEHVDVRIEPIGLKVFGMIDLVAPAAGSEYPGIRLLCTGIRELLRDFNL